MTSQKKMLTNIKLSKGQVTLGDKEKGKINLKRILLLLSDIILRENATR